MDEQLTAAAKTLARWCYRRGVDERILSCGEQLLQAAVDQRSADRRLRTASTPCGTRPPCCCASGATGTAPTR